MHISGRKHITRILLVVLLFAVSTAIPSALAAEPEQVDLDVLTLIRQEGFRNSKVMEVLSELCDRFGARVTGSPALKMANEWTRDQLTTYGLVNAHLESYGPFGRGWSEELTSVRMVSPSVATLFALPNAWTPGTNGIVRGKVMKVQIAKREDLEKYRGKLAGMILLRGETRQVKPQTEPAFSRLSDQKLSEYQNYTVPAPSQPAMQSGGSSTHSHSNLTLPEFNKFLQQEKVLAVIDPSRYDGGAISMSISGSRTPGDSVGVPRLTMAVEHYNRISRLLDRNIAVELELNVQTKFYDDDLMAYNTIAEIPGTDKKDEIVLVGAHLDSMHGGTGATDDASGVAVAMEAVRILKAIGVKPRRTIRIALWSGEEEGLLGSGAYVKQHVAARLESKDPRMSAFANANDPPYVLQPEHSKISAYFNLDNGTGRIRGIYLQRNQVARPIFEAWIEPLKDLGVTTVTMHNTNGTDFLSFDAVGVPGFQFIQDPIEYGTRTHHSSMDVYDRIPREDVIQSSVVMATFIYNAAMRDQLLPRKPFTGEIVKP